MLFIFQLVFQYETSLKFLDNLKCYLKIYIQTYIEIPSVSVKEQ